MPQEDERQPTLDIALERMRDCRKLAEADWRVVVAVILKAAMERVQTDETLRLVSPHSIARSNEPTQNSLRNDWAVFVREVSQPL